MVWDTETSKHLKIPSNESCCSISWLPQHDSVFFVGNSMGWMKTFDARCPASPVMNWLAHPANRPRKIKGIKPCFLDCNIVASFSDAVGDFVKVWDLRMVEVMNTAKPQKKGGGITKCFAINPYLVNFDEYNNNILTSASISDIAWSPSRTEVLAVITSNSKGISFFKCDFTKIETSPSPETTIPISSIHIPDTLKSLSWQWIDPNEINTSRPSILETLNKHSEKSLPHLDVKWEETIIDAKPYKFPVHLLNHAVDSILEPIRSSKSKRLLGFTSQCNIFDTDVREAVPFAFSEQKLILQTHHGVKIFEMNGISSQQDCIHSDRSSAILRIQNYLNDINYLMKDRASAGYSFDASTNLDILSEEIEFYSKFINSVYSHESYDFRFAEVYSLTLNLQEIQRVWWWIDRMETSISQTKLSLHNCGIISLFSSYISSSASVSESLIDPSTGAILFSSEARSLIRKTCGWITLADNENLDPKDTFSGKSSDAGSLVSSDMDGENRDLLEELIDDCTGGYERAAMLALWHGNIDLAVQILHEAIENHASQKSSLSDHLNSSNIDDDEEYMQTVALVASCIAGYYVKIPDLSLQPRYPGSLMNWSTPSGNFRHQIHSQNERSSWKSMCLLTLSKLKRFHRSNVHYLIAGCNFLLVNIDDPAGKSEDFLFSSYLPLLDDEKISLEDRVAFAASYLNDNEFLSWMNTGLERYKRDGNLEGLLLTGVSNDGIELLQTYLDKTADLQTVSLLTARILSSITYAEDENLLSDKIGRWVDSYRRLLIKWELYTERAHLDIEISQQITKNNESRSKMSSKLPSTASHLDLLSKSQHGERNPSSQATTQNAKLKISSSHLGGKTSQAKTIPVFEGIYSNFNSSTSTENLNFYYIKLKCNFCGSSLPSDEVPSKNMDSLRIQKSILNFCSNCNKQLPRCYVCQLYMVNLSS